MRFESENVKFKLKFTDELYKEVIAFANTEGGVIYVGVDNEGRIVGIDDVDDSYTRITNGIRDAIMPDVTMFCRYSIEDGEVIRISVSDGSNKPYYLKAKGIKPSGVFVRQGSSSVPASHDKIRALIKETDGDSYEEMRSMEQNLTFKSASSAFSRYGVEFSETKYRALGISSKSDELFTNLALILSDQCAHTTKVAVFADEENTEFRDSREFCGSVFEQLEGAYAYLTLCNKKSATFSGLERIETPDYPDAALREALLNAIVHRDYSYSGSIIINVNEKEMEFVSIGGLLHGLLKDDILNGISQPRNKCLADVFHRLRLIESYGTGIRRIYKMYEKCSEKPRIEVTPNTFKVVLPNMNRYGAIKPIESNPTQKQLILDYIERKGEITDLRIQELLGLKKTRAFMLAKEMRDEGLIASVGRGAQKRYVKI